MGLLGHNVYYTLPTNITNGIYDIFEKYTIYMSG